MIRITRYCLFFSKNFHHKKGYPFWNILSPSVASLFPVALLFSPASLMLQLLDNVISLPLDVAVSDAQCAVRIPLG